MKASQFSEAQKAFILKQGRDGMAVAEICRKAGISQATYCRPILRRGGGFPLPVPTNNLIQTANGLGVG
jgi:putative transposase